VYLANQGVIELHVPTITSADWWHPNRFVIDLDPPEGALARVREAARIVREALQRWGLETVPVATGSKGYHVVAALSARASADRVALAAHKAAALLEQRHPELLTNAFRVKERGGRVFLDWMRNQPFATVVAPFSLRARPRPTVAAVLEWDEIDRIDPDGIDIDAVQARLSRPDALAALDERPSDDEAFVRAVDDAFAASGLELVPFDRFRS
jgi:bifunctional non-homologous end joining protein LigD